LALADLRPLLSTAEGKGLTEQSTKDTFASVLNETAPRWENTS